MQTRNQKNIHLSVVLLVILTILVGCSSTTPTPSSGEPLSMIFMAGYKPQASLPFVGVYVAQEKGYFATRGVKVQIEHTPGRGEHLQLTAAGKVQVTTQDAAVLLQRRADPGLPIVSFALIGQTGEQAYASLTSSGFKTPKDWEGHTVGYKGTPSADLYALLDAVGVATDRIELINVGFDPRLLLEKKVDVYPVYLSNEPFLLKKLGAELTVWKSADFGIPLLGLTYVTSEETLAKNPEMLGRFLGGALDGIRYAKDHPEEATDIVMKYAGAETDPELMRYMLDMELGHSENAVTKEHGLGWQTVEQWQALADMLAKHNALNGSIAVDKAFTNQILEGIQKAQ